MTFKTSFERVAAHELALLALGVWSLGLTAWRDPRAWAAMFPLAAVTLVYGVALAVLCRRSDRSRERARFLASCAFILCFYLSVYGVVPALGFPSYDHALLECDRAVFGDTPAVWLRRHSSPPLMDLFSVGYLGFHLYLAVTLAREWLLGPRKWNGLADTVFTTFAIGFAGYLIVPALGPLRAFPELFHGMTSGGLVSEVAAWIVDRGSSLYDVFPSLHVAVTLVLLDHDFRHSGRFFWLALPVGAAAIVSTVYLGHHYAVDAFAGAALYGAVRWGLFREANRVAAGREGTAGKVCHGFWRSQKP